MDTLLTIEFLFRGATAGILLLATVIFSRSDNPVQLRGLGCLFLIALAGYVVISSPIIARLSGLFFYPLTALSSWVVVFFWWFATALFGDNFKLKSWRLVPFILMVGLFCIRWFVAPSWNGSTADIWLHNSIDLALTIHALWIAIAHRNDDLVEPRRSFRLSFSLLVGLLSTVIGVGELVIGGSARSNLLTFWHAAILFTVTFGAISWVTLVVARPKQMAPSSTTTKSTAQMRRDDAAYLTKLNDLMNEGIYKREGLTIASLATEVGVPEHRLRKLINNALGFRNFTAFLNSRRIADAREILADPEQARRQITQIAFDLGYGSVGPFNRAFKVDTGHTPSEFRLNAMAQEVE